GDFARGYDERVDGLASHFVWTNRSKESLTLDLKQDDAMQVLDKLLSQADVLVQNLAPGAAARMGLSFDVLHECYPRLIVCDISGYGEGGPYEQKKAYDLLIQSEGGFLSVTGGPGEDEMAKAGCSIADIAAGMYAYTGVLSALMLREKTGKGSRVDVSMLESLVEWMGYPLYYAYKGATPPPRAGAAHATIYPYGPFPAGDGKTVMLGLQNERARASRVGGSMRDSLVAWMGYPLSYACKGATPPPRAGAAHATIYPYGPFPAGDGKTVMLGLQNEREWVAFCEKVLLKPELA